jgi:hypothetical protein
MLERYYTENGLPIDEDKTFDWDGRLTLLTTPAETNPAYEDFRGYLQPNKETLKMYQYREARFYANMGITGGYWRGHKGRIPTFFYNGYYGSTTAGATGRIFVTGIGIQKWIHPESTTTALTTTAATSERTVKSPSPIIRLADLYLMKAEALNEYLDAPTQEVWNAINEVRRRAGIPNVETVWSDAGLAKTVNKHKDKDGMRDIILHERSVELAFEGQHFWDMWRHKKAHTEFVGATFGWNFAGANANAFFGNPVAPMVINGQDRIFALRDYLWPISINELNINSNLIQNPGW